MPYFQRKIDLVADIAQKSLFLFGPRQTGKTELLRHVFPDALFLNLLHADVFLRLSQRPESLREVVASTSVGPPPLVILDEIQKLPLLLDEVQALMQTTNARFILTGSSTRKLKRGGANLLGGRAWITQLFPLVSAEIPHYDLLRLLNFGALPSVYLSQSPERELESYVGAYLQEEIQAESAVRRIEHFSRFLQTAALCNGELLNFSNVASDCGVHQRTVKEYFEILQDTLVGLLLEPYAKSKKRKAIATAKFYFFDVGVSNFLAGRVGIRPKTELFGKALEHFLLMELRAWLSYRHDRRPLSFWRSTSGYEVDFLIGDEIAIEVKASDHVVEKHCAGLKALAEERPLAKQIVVSLDPLPRRIGNIDVKPITVFLQELWAGAYGEVG